MYRLTSVQNELLSPEADGTGPNVEIEEEDGNQIEEDSEEDSEGDDEEDGEGEEEEGKEDKEDDGELDLARVSLKEITSKHPSIFKDFPSLKHAFFREQQFTELFPTVEDAKRAAEAQAAYEEIASAVVDGDATKFLSELKIENPDAVEKFANSFLPALRETNKDAYFNIVAPQVQQFVKNVYAHGVNEKDDNIKNAAKIVHKILFGGSYEDVEREMPPIMTRGAKSGDETVDKDKQRYFSEKYGSLYKEVTDFCYSRLDEEIEKGLSDLDKSQKGLKRILASEIKNKVLSEMDKDPAYMGRMKALWQRERRTGFSGQLKQSFATTFIAKAKTLVAKTRSEVRREALGKEDKNGKGDATRISGGKAPSSKGKPMTADRQRSEKLTTRQVFDD